MHFRLVALSLATAAIASAPASAQASDTAGTIAPAGEADDGLRFFAEKVKYFNTCKKLVRTDAVSPESAGVASGVWGEPARIGIWGGAA